MVSFVATPIGNLKDMTFRAVEALKEADVIFCEDTRHTLGLLNAYEIKKPLLACHKFNERRLRKKFLPFPKREKKWLWYPTRARPSFPIRGIRWRRFYRKRASRSR